MRSPLPLPLLLALASCGGGGASGIDDGGGVGTLGEVRFETRAEIPVGIAGVADAVCADLNGDGRADLAVTSVTGSVRLLLGGGDGTFADAGGVALPGQPALLQVGDVDGDADLDLCVLAWGADVIVVLANDGNANFVERQRLAVGSFTDALALGDCNGDGRSDLVVARFGESRLRMFPGIKGGSFELDSFMALPDGVSPGGLVIGDLTGDSLGDLVVSDTVGNRVLVIPGAEDGGHAAPRSFAVGEFPMAMAIGDLSRDGRVDLVVSNVGSDTVSVLINDGADFAQLVVPIDGPPGNPTIGDVNGDRIEDLVVCVFNRATISIFVGLRSGGLAAETQMCSTGFPFRALIDDVDGNGTPDLLVSGNRDRLGLYMGQAGQGQAGRLTGSVNYPTGLDTPEFLAAADFDGDGAAEIAVAGQGAERIVLLGATAAGPDVPAFAARLEVAVGRPCFNLVDGDFDGDGRIDLAVSTDLGIKVLGNASAGGRLAFDVFPGAGDAVFAPGSGPFEIAAGDFNADGRTDLVVADYRDDKITALLATGDFAYAERSWSVETGDRPGGIVLADFTGDTVLDLAISRNGSAQVSVLRGDGRGGFEPWIDEPVGPRPNYLRTADFDRDGRADLVVSVAGSDKVVVLLTRNQGFVPLSFPSGEVPTALATEDLNRDGNPDILVASLSGADFRVLLGDGRGGFPTVLTFPGTFKATSADLADLNGDGLVDLIVASLHTTRVSVYRNVSR